MGAKQAKCASVTNHRFGKAEFGVLSRKKYVSLKSSLWLGLRMQIFVNSLNDVIVLE